MKKSLLVILLLFAGVYLKGQSELFIKLDMSKGFIIINADTIFCYIEYLENYGSRIKIMKNKEDTKAVIIKTKDIDRLEVGGLCFEKLEYKGKSNFLRLTVDGSVKLYEVHKSGTSHSYDSKSGLPSGSGMPYDYHIFYLLKDGKVYKIMKKKQLAKVLPENPEIAEKIENMTKLNQWLQIRKIVRTYNKWLEGE